MSLNDEERAQFVARFRDEVEAEHARREARRRLTPSKAEQEDRLREAELARLRRQVREAWFEEHGYVKVLDGRGNARWVHPDDAERRKKKKRRAPIVVAQWTDNKRRMLIAAAVVAVAIVLGVLIGL